MVDRAESHIGVPPNVPPLPVSWSRAFLTYVPLAVILGLGAIFAIIVMVPVAFALIIGAVPYTLIATFLILRKRRAARKSLDAMEDFQIEMSTANFGSRSQKLSLINGVVLGLLGILLLTSTASAPVLPDSTMFIMSLIAVFSTLEIIVNARWIYRRQTVLAEEYALRTRTHSWALILVNRWLGWVIWYTGAALAGFVLVSQPSDFFGW